MPRVEKGEKERPLHTYRCKHKHIYQDFGPWEITVVNSGNRTFSGPLCPFCYMAWLAEHFCTKEVLQ